MEHTQKVPELLADLAPKVVTIGGRKFHGVTQELSAGQDDYLFGHLREAGALELLDAGRAGNQPELTTEDLLTRIMISGRSPHVLAGCLTEIGKPWTFEDAARNAAIFAAITNPADKAIMRAEIVGFVIGFFQFATAYAETSRKSSLPN